MLNWAIGIDMYTLMCIKLMPNKNLQYKKTNKKKKKKKTMYIPKFKDTLLLDFPGGAVVKNPPASAGDTGSIPGPGRSHMPQSNYAHEPQLLSLRSRAHMPQLLSPCATTTEAHTPRAMLCKRSHNNERCLRTATKSSPC